MPVKRFDKEPYSYLSVCKVSEENLLTLKEGVISLSGIVSQMVMSRVKTLERSVNCWACALGQHREMDSLRSGGGWGREKICSAVVEIRV